MLWLPELPEAGEPAKEFQQFLAAERQGSVRLFYANEQRQVAGETLRSESVPLLSVDYNEGQVGVVADGRVVSDPLRPPPPTTTHPPAPCCVSQGGVLRIAAAVDIAIVRGG